MTPILNALAQGYSSQSIISFLTNAFPHLKDKIKRAESSGYSPNQILNYINALSEKEKFRPDMTAHEIEAQHQKKYDEIAKKILGTAATSAATAAFVSRIPSLLSKLPIGPKPMGGAPVAPLQPSAEPNLQPTQQQPPVAPSPQTQERMASIEQAKRMTPEFRQYANQQISEGKEKPLDQMLADFERLQGKKPKGLVSKIAEDVKQMEEPNAPSVETTVPQQQETPEKKKSIVMTPEEWRKKQSGAEVKEEEKGRKYVGKFRNIHVNKTYPVFQDPKTKKYFAIGEQGDEHEFPDTIFQKHFEQVEGEKSESVGEPFPAAKGDVVELPSGEIGEIEDHKDKEALVKDDEGKLHKLKIGDLKKPNETVVQTVSRLLEIPEIDKSALISYWSYDPIDRQLFILFHNGENYKYLDVPKELADELSEAAVSPKTQGENQFGAWSQEDPQSRGATAIQKIINDPKYKRAKKGEPANQYYRKLKKGYDYWQRLRSK